MSENTLKVALAQMEVVAGQPAKNFATISSFVSRAKALGADIVVFPELCVGGRFLGSRWHDAAFISSIADYDENILALSDGIGILYGNCEGLTSGGIDYPSPEADAYLSTARFCLDGAWLEVAGCDCDGECDCGDDCDCDGECDCGGDCHCSHAPVYYFNMAGIEAEIAICLGDVSGCDQAVSPFMRDFALDLDDDCNVVFDLCATPFSVHKRLPVAQTAESPEDEGAVDAPPVVRVNCVGMQNTDKAVLSFDGGSTVFASDGTCALRCRDDFQEELLLVQIGLETRQVTPLSDSGFAGYEDVDEKTLDAIVWTLRRFDEQVFPFHPKWVIGLSGGIDSSVTAALMHLAFGGSERIVGYNLATRYNSDATKMNAYDLAQALGIRLVNGSIEEIVEATRAVVSLYGYSDDATEGLVLENIQARLRGHMLSTFAAIEGGVVMNNGNKVEAALGYATLYGDAIGAIAPIGDITKVRLFRISRLINKRLGKAAIPENLIPVETDDGYRWETMPSAELKDAQKDPMKWFYHDWLVENLLDRPEHGIEDLMEAYLEDKLASSPVAKWVSFYGLDNPQAFIEDLEWIQKQMANSVFKRIQMPPTIMVVRDTYGFDFRENQMPCERTPRYEELKRQILAMP